MNIVYPITFKLQEVPSEEAIAGAYVSVWDSTFNNLIIPNLTTDENGFAVIGLTSGLYNSVFFHSGYTFPYTRYFEVTNTPLINIVEGNVTVVSPLVKGYCLLYGYLKDISSKAIFDSKVKIRLNPAPQWVGDNLISKEDYIVYTDENGYFEISLLGNTKVTVTVLEANFQVTGMLPSSGRMNVTELNKQFSVK